MFQSLGDVFINLGFNVIIFVLGLILMYYYLTKTGPGLSDVPLRSILERESSEDVVMVLKEEGIEKDKIEKVLNRMEQLVEARAFSEYLLNFLLPPEFRVFQAMTEAIIDDTEDASMVPLTAGWRNKNQLRVASGVSRKRIYGRGGIAARFVKLGLAITRESPSRWGRQKLQYRLNTDIQVVKDYISTIWKIKS